jgi:hypothetical protein
MTEILKATFRDSVMDYYVKYENTLRLITNFIAELDFLVSGAVVADKYYYCQPTIVDLENSPPSYIEAQQLRHPIIERLCEETEYIPNDVELGAKDGKNGMLVYALNFAGKCLAPDTNVMMINGRTKMAKDIVKGDQLMGDDSSARNVLGTCKGRAQMYQIIPERGEPYTVNGPHILCLKSSAYQSVMWDERRQYYRVGWMEEHKCRSKSFSVSNYGSKKRARQTADDFLKNVKSDKGKILHISVDEYMTKNAYWKRNYYTYHVGVTFPEQDVEIDPYIIGHWLGDGNSRDGGFTSADQEIVDYYTQYFKNSGVNVKYTKEYRYSITTGLKTGGAKRNWFINALRKYDLIDNKHIPYEYLCNSRENQLKLLAGLIDSDGHNNDNRMVEIVQKNERLADDIVYLVRSLGFFCIKKKCKKTCTNGNNGPVVGTYYRMHIIGNDYSDIPLLMEYKRPESFARKRKLDHQMVGFKIKPIGEGDYCGFELDGNHRFLLGDFTVTHNSSFMKSIGLAVILAQIGYYVPAKSFTYEPYMAIYARINANDNMLKGLSSFVLEMTEIDSILKRVQNNGENTLVIGDEVCRGTEITSAISLVSSTLVTLSKSNATFIFSSHLHELKEIDEVKALTNLRLFHLKVDIDTKNNRLVFERKLTPGTGPSIYGVMVAKHMINNPDFINTAEIIKNRLLNNETFDFPTKQSKWNPKLIITKCALCSYKPTQINHKELETHHINFQKNCCKDNKIIEKPHLTKNGLYNLVILCRPCHEKVHKGNITIDSYKCTTDGPKLFYTNDENVKKDINC